MNIIEGFNINENQFVRWNVSFEEFKNICKKNNIDYQLEMNNILKEIILSMNFANLGKLRASIYFINESIKEIYFTNENIAEFHLNQYLSVDNDLILYFGKPKIRNSRQSLWEFDKIRIKHFYIQKDDTVMDYLVLENHYC